MKLKLIKIINNYNFFEEITSVTKNELYAPSIRLNQYLLNLGLSQKGEDNLSYIFEGPDGTSIGVFLENRNKQDPDNAKYFICFEKDKNKDIQSFNFYSENDWKRFEFLEKTIKAELYKIISSTGGLPPIVNENNSIKDIINLLKPKN